MKSIRYILFALVLPVATSMMAQEVAGSQIRIDNKVVSLGADTQLQIGMDVTIPTDMEVNSNTMLMLTPVLVEKNTDGATKALPAIYVYGRARQVVAERNGKIPADAFTVLRRDNGTSQTIQYNARVPYEKWMNGSELKMMAAVQGCANCVKEENLAVVCPVLLERYQVKPAIAFVKPAAEVKIRAEKGSAYLDFPVNQTKIYPDYRRNPYELEKIDRTISVVKENADTKITGITLHGYASPEGSYSNNARLAKGRSEALKNFVMGKYSLSADMFIVESTPEDWAGLRAYVEENNVAHKSQVLDLIDSKIENLDAKEARIKALDPQMYQSLLQNCYPGLRHTDYVIHYTVRPYNLDEAKSLLKSRPQLLSLEEMYLVALTYAEGSEEYNDVFDIAVRMYPQDPIANINAAAMELKRGNVDQAQRYLQRSDASSAAVQNNKGVYYLLKGDLAEAESCLNKAKSLGSTEAVANLEELRKKQEDNRAFKE